FAGLWRLPLARPFLLLGAKMPNQRVCFQLARIEEFGAELNPVALGHPEIFEAREIPGYRAGPVQDIPARRAIQSRRSFEGRRVEEAVDELSAVATRVEMRIADHVRPICGDRIEVAV